MQVCILDRISAAAGELSKGEKAIAKSILDDPKLAATENIAELAKRSGVSQPTVCRFCTRFGTSGFREFRLELKKAVNEEKDPPLQSIHSGDTVSDVITKVFTSLVITLKNAERDINADIMARAIDLVSQSGRIVVAAQGLSSFTAQDFSSKLLDLGMHCEFYSDPALLLRACASLHAGEILILISAEGNTKDLLQAALIAQENGASLLTLCPAGSPLNEVSPLNLNTVTDSEPNAVTAGRISSLAYLQCICAGVSLRRADLVKPLRGKIDKALNSLAYKIEQDKKDQKNGIPSQEVLTADSPITVLNWKL